MASHSHGYYGLGGASRTADFGLAASMTLPLVTPVDNTGDPASGTMPTEKGSRKKAARFAVETDESHVSQTQQDAVPVTTKPSWRHRLSGLFRRHSKKDKSHEEAGGIQTITEEKTKLEERAMPTRTVDDLEVDVRKAKGKRKKKNKRPRSTAFDESTKEGYLPSLSPDATEGSTDILKLALRPKGAGGDFESIKVTLRRKVDDGFGIHLSGGLPPISVTYVQPGSEAESARIMVGDIVTEVNGHDCVKGIDISKIMGLKSLIQQSSIDGGEEQVDVGSWEKIKEKQVELESDNSEDGEITRIDDTSDSEEEQKSPTEEPKDDSLNHKPSMPKEEPSKKIVAGPKSSTPKKSSKKTKKSSQDNNNHTNLSAISNETNNEEQLVITPTSPSEHLELPPVESPNLVTVGVIKKSKRKKSSETAVTPKSEVNNSSLVESPAKLATKEDDQSQDNETPKKVKKKKKKTKPKSTEEKFPPRSKVYEVEGSPPTELGVSRPPESPEAQTEEPPTRDKNATPKRKKGAKPKGKVKKKKMQDSPDDHPKKHQLAPSTSGSKLKSNKAFEEHDDLEWVDSGGLEVTEHEESTKPGNLDRRKSVDLAHLAEGENEDLQAITSEKRSTSHHDLSKEDRKLFREELRQASKSEYDIAQDQGHDEPKVDIDPNVRVTKSGVVIGKRKTSIRPSIFETEGGEPEKEGKKREEGDPVKKKGKRKHKRKLVMEMDISAVPKTSPSLGLKHGHERLDVVSRSVSKRRPASLRKTLLLDSNKEVLMGKERVDLTKLGDDKPLRRTTMPEKDLKKPDKQATTPEEVYNIDEPISRPRRQSIAEYMESLQKTKYSSLSRSPPSTETNTLHEEQVQQPVTVRESQVTDSPSFAAARKLFQQKDKEDFTTSTPNFKNGALPSEPKTNKAEVKPDTSPVLKPSTPETSQEQPRSGGRRAKTVDQPVKKLGIASEPIAPAWVSIAQKKRDRTSVMYGEQSPPPANTAHSSQLTKPQTSPLANTPLSNGVSKQQDGSIPKMGTVKDRMAMFQKNK